MSFSPSTAAYRFGLGLPQVGAPDAEAMLQALTAADAMALRWPIAGAAEVTPVLRAARLTKEAARNDPTLEQSAQQAQVQILGLGDHGLRHTLARLLDTQDGFRERLVAFWADHFTVAGGTEGLPLIYAMIEEAIRANLTAPFATMLTAVTLHPAMLIYLDQARSIGPNSPQGKKKGLGLNENHARELMELHSLGVGAGYGQDDVRQLAELMTGLSYDQKRGFFFEARRVEPGPETVLGKTYDGKGMDPILAVLNDLALRPETARHIARKLVVHFIADQPDAELVEALAKVWQATGGDLLAVYTALVQHPAAWSGPARKVRQPWEFLIAAYRGLGVTGAGVMAWDASTLKQLFMAPLQQMGQPWKGARGPDGWPEQAEAWITPQGLAVRIDWAMTQPARIARPLPLPLDLARQVLGDRMTETVQRAAERAENRAEGVGLVLASPEFNRR